MANKGPEGFLEAQRECYRLLEDKHYHSFLPSESYHQLIVESKKLDMSTFGREKSGRFTTEVNALDDFVIHFVLSFIEEEISGGKLMITNVYCS